VQYEIEVGGSVRHVSVEKRAAPAQKASGPRSADGLLRVVVDGKAWDVDAARLDDTTLSLIIHGLEHSRAYEVSVAPDAATSSRAVQVGRAVLSAAVLDSRRRRRGAEEGSASGSGPQRLSAPMPGKIARVLVKTGEVIRARQPLVVIEAMKMENELRAGRDGTVTEIHTREGASVDAGALLVVIL
jgi:biotin carboxyl carrier protein